MDSEDTAGDSAEAPSGGDVGDEAELTISDLFDARIGQVQRAISACVLACATEQYGPEGGPESRGPSQMS